MTVSEPMPLTTPGGVVKRYRRGQWRPVHTDPDNWVAPVISGAATQTDVAAVAEGDWQATQPLTYTYQWRRDGVPIDPLPVNTVAPTITLDS